MWKQNETLKYSLHSWWDYYACVTFLVTVMQPKGNTVDFLEVAKPWGKFPAHACIVSLVETTENCMDSKISGLVKSSMPTCKDIIMFGEQAVQSF